MRGVLPPDGSVSEYYEIYDKNKILDSDTVASHQFRKKKRNKFTSSLEKRERKIKNPSLSKLLLTWSVTRNFLENGASDVMSGIVITKNSDSLS